MLIFRAIRIVNFCWYSYVRVNIVSHQKSFIFFVKDLFLTYSYVRLYSCTYVGTSGIFLNEIFFFASVFFVPKFIAYVSMCTEYNVIHFSTALTTKSSETSPIFHYLLLFTFYRNDLFLILYIFIIYIYYLHVLKNN